MEPKFRAENGLPPRPAAAPESPQMVLAIFWEEIATVPTTSALLSARVLVFYFKDPLKQIHATSIQGD